MLPVVLWFYYDWVKDQPNGTSAYTLNYTVAPMTGRDAILALILLFTALPLAGDFRRRPHHVEGLATASEHGNAEVAELKRRGNVLFRAGEYLNALRIYEIGYQESTRQGDLNTALRFLNNIGSADYLLLRYRDAIKAYLQARPLAIAQHDQEGLAAIYSNLSSLYDQVGEIDAATESAERGLELPANATTRLRSKLLIQSAFIQMRRSDFDGAIRGFRQAIETAQTQLDVSTEALAWNELGNALLERGRLPDAEAALLESYRLRRLSHDERLHFSYESLGELRLRQNDRASALILLDRAIQSAAPLGPLAVWKPFYARGKANLAAANLPAAYADFSQSLQSLKRWWAEVPPADAFRVGAEAEMHDVYSAFIELAARLYRETGQKRYAEESFGAAEDSRAASLRALWLESGLTKDLPADYRQTVSALQEAETAQLRNVSAEGAIRRLRLKLTEMEAGAALELPLASLDPDPSDSRLLERTRRALGTDEVFIGFHTGDSESSLWAITPDAFEFRELPPKGELDREIRTFVEALKDGSKAADRIGWQLYDRLFGGISPKLRQKPTWVLALDGPLFDLPFAALLQTSQSESRRYLIEDHAIRIVPAMSALLRSPSRRPDGSFVGLGDPIYNRADLRWLQAESHDASSAETVPPVGSGGRILELPRLIGSAREVESCAAIWRANGQKTLVLEGMNANKRALAQALQQNPSVLHVAAHVLFPPQRAAAGMVAFGMQPGDQIEMLTNTDITSMRAQLELIVVDGCSSGNGPVLPGAGLMALTRAWLVAGARAVIATRWATHDQETGRLFSSLYRIYFQRSHRPVSFGRLLREAQLAELHSGGPRAAPAYWATYFCVETN